MIEPCSNKKPHKNTHTHIKTSQSINLMFETYQFSFLIMQSLSFSADSVYMHETSKLTEYVLKDTGNIYRGSSKRVSRINWAFGQVCSTLYRKESPLLTSLISCVCMLVNHSLILHFETVPKVLQTTTEMGLLKDFKIHIA